MPTLKYQQYNIKLEPDVQKNAQHGVASTTYSVYRVLPLNAIRRKKRAPKAAALPPPPPAAAPPTPPAPPEVKVEVQAYAEATAEAATATATAYQCCEGFLIDPVTTASDLTDYPISHTAVAAVQNLPASYQRPGQSAGVFSPTAMFDFPPKFRIVPPALLDQPRAKRQKPRCDAAPLLGGIMLVSCFVAVVMHGGNSVELAAPDNTAQEDKECTGDNFCIQWDEARTDFLNSWSRGPFTQSWIEATKVVVQLEHSLSGEDQDVVMPPMQSGQCWGVGSDPVQSNSKLQVLDLGTAARASLADDLLAGWQLRQSDDAMVSHRWWPRPSRRAVVQSMTGEYFGTADHAHVGALAGFGAMFGGEYDFCSAADVWRKFNRANPAVCSIDLGPLPRDPTPGTADLLDDPLAQNVFFPPDALRMHNSSGWFLIGGVEHWTRVEATAAAIYLAGIPGEVAGDTGTTYRIPLTPSCLRCAYCPPGIYSTGSLSPDDGVNSDLVDFISHRNHASNTPCIQHCSITGHCGATSSFRGLGTTDCHTCPAAELTTTWPLGRSRAQSWQLGRKLLLFSGHFRMAYAQRNQASQELSVTTKDNYLLNDFWEISFSLGNGFDDLAETIKSRMFVEPGSVIAKSLGLTAIQSRCTGDRAKQAFPAPRVDGATWASTLPIPAHGSNSMQRTTSQQPWLFGGIGMHSLSPSQCSTVISYSDDWVGNLCDLWVYHGSTGPEDQARWILVSACERDRPHLAGVGMVPLLSPPPPSLLSSGSVRGMPSAAVLSASWVTVSGGTDNALWLFGGVTSHGQQGGNGSSTMRAAAGRDDDPIVLMPQRMCSSELWRFDQSGQWTLMGDGSSVDRHDQGLAWPPETCGAKTFLIPGAYGGAGAASPGEAWLVGGWGPNTHDCQDRARIENRAVPPDQESGSSSLATCDANRVLWRENQVARPSADQVKQ